MSIKYNWPLCADTFTFWDKVKISKFLFTEKIWTYGEWVKKLEKKWSEFLHGTPCVIVSSGSTANELIALRRKWELQQVCEWPRRNKVVAPVNTWISSITPFIHSGYDIVFSDVAPNNLNIYSYHLKEIFAKDINKEIGTVFYTALLGFFGDLHECKRLTEEHGARFLMDNCEATFSYIEGKLPGESKNLMSFATSSTSFYWSHFAVSGTEMGMITCETQEEFEWYSMMKCHGLTRGMPDKYKNVSVSPDFDFALLGSNYRSSNLQAFMALLDIERATDFSLNKRKKIFDAFYFGLDGLKFDSFSQTNMGAAPEHGRISPLAIPIIAKTKELKVKAELFCKLNGVQTRPLIGGCLCKHTAFKGICKAEDYSVSLNAHETSFYIGLNKNVTEKMAFELAQDLNKL